MIEPFITHWVYGGSLAGVLLLILFPLVTRGWPRSLAFTFLLLPVYMLHQCEEHTLDRFRIFFNQSIGGGHEALSSLAVFIINVPGVWGLITLSLYLAAKVDIGLGMIAAYLVLINGIAHIGHGILFQGYNPGLVSAILVFVPLGLYTLRLIHADCSRKPLAHAIGLASGVGIHAAIILFASMK
jgi:hypothetical protein